MFSCETPYFIWFHQRSGSTYLASLLDSDPHIVCWPELFFHGEGQATADYFNKSGVASEGRFLSYLYNKEWGYRGANLPFPKPVLPTLKAVGFKLKYEQADRYPRVIEFLRSHSTSISVLHLVRRNLLKTLVSSAMLPTLLDTYQRPNLSTDCSLDAIRRNVRLDCDSILQELEQLERSIQHSTAAIRDFNVCNITYEDLYTDRQETCRRALLFLGVEPSLPLQSNYVKIMPNQLELAIENYGDVYRTLSKTRFHYLLRDE